jgi:Outer membrane protein beta-barrel domain
MKLTVFVLAACLAGAGIVSAQDTTGTSSSSAKDQEGTYVRRISGGITLSVLGLVPIKAGNSSNTSQVNSATTLTTNDSTTGKSSRIGYGVTAQVAINDHFALAVGAYLRRIGYDFTSTLTTDVTTFVNGASGTTETTTSTTESTRARLLDVPIMLRFYFKNRHAPGPRFFVEGGGAWRDLRSGSSSLSSTDNTGTVSCCTSSAVQPAHRNARGFLGGAGAQFIDPFGIRVMPEVRYTRWVSPIFDNATTHNQRNQVEVDLTLSF